MADSVFRLPFNPTYQPTPTPPPTIVSPQRARKRANTFVAFRMALSVFHQCANERLMRRGLFHGDDESDDDDDEVALNTRPGQLRVLAAALVGHVADAYEGGDADAYDDDAYDDDDEQEEKAVDDIEAALARMHTPDVGRPAKALKRRAATEPTAAAGDPLLGYLQLQPQKRRANATIPYESLPAVWRRLGALRPKRTERGFAGFEGHDIRPWVRWNFGTASAAGDGDSSGSDDRTLEPEAAGSPLHGIGVDMVFEDVEMAEATTPPPPPPDVVEVGEMLEAGGELELLSGRRAEGELCALL